MDAKYTSREERILVMESTLDKLLERMEDPKGLSAQDFSALVREARQVSKELREESIPFDEHREVVKSPFEKFFEKLSEQ